MKRTALVSFATACLWSCGDVQSPTLTDQGFGPVDSFHGSMASGVHGGSPHFFFLPPLAPKSTFSGTFDGSLDPVVKICAWTGTECDGPPVAELTTEGRGSQRVRVKRDHYSVKWHTKRFNLLENQVYRISVLVEGMELGHLDVQMVKKGKRKSKDKTKKLELGDPIRARIGKPLRIRFRIEDGALPLTHGPITVDPSNPSWLIYQNGDPFFMVGPGDPEGFLYRGTRNPDGTRSGDQLSLINTLAPTGANSIYLMAVRSHGGDGGPTENPFVDSDPANPLDQDILDQWETWFAAMDAAGIVTVFFFYDDGADPWGGSTMGSAEQQFIADLVNRFKHHDNLIWCLAEEYSESLTATRASQIASEIRTNDPTHPIAVHQLTGTTFDFPDDPDVDQFAMQLKGSISGLHSKVVTAWSQATGRYNLNASESRLKTGTPQGLLPTADVRQISWAAVMGGAYVMVFGWDIASTSTVQLEQAGYIVRFMEKTRINKMAPDDSRAFGSTDWVLVEAPSQSFIAYALNATGAPGVTTMEAGLYDLTWLDTVTGATMEQTGVTVTAGDNTFPIPVGIGTELAVYIRKAGL